MTKIDTSKIEGFEAMTPEERVKALEEFEFSTDYSGYVRKDLFDKTASEAAEWKKKFRETQSTADQEKASRDEELASMKEELDSLRRDKVVAGYVNQYVALGYSAEMAQSTAEALASGDTATVFKNQTAFLAEHDKDITAKAMKSTPRPSVGTGNGVVTRADLAKMTAQERYVFSETHPDEYRAAYENSKE